MTAKTGTVLQRVGRSCSEGLSPVFAEQNHAEEPDLPTLERTIAAADEQTYGLVHALHGLAKDELLVVEGAAP